ncbi:hypothetical protein GCM10027566_09030 [Arachidicoccus ginsenosidivorans]
MENIDKQYVNKNKNNIEKPDLWQDIRQYLEQPRWSNTEESGKQLGNDSSQDLQNGREDLCKVNLGGEENQFAQQGQNMDQYQKQNSDQDQLPIVEFGSTAHNSTNKTDFSPSSDNLFSSNKCYNTTNYQTDKEYNLMNKTLSSNTKLRQNSSIVITAELKKKRQLLLVLPLLVLPFVSMAFWALGGGGLAAVNSDGNNNDKSKATGAGINTTIPKADLASGMSDKMTAYREAAKLGADRYNAKQQDGYYRGSDSLDVLGSFAYPNATDSLGHAGGKSQDLILGEDCYEDPNTLKVEQKLAALQKIIASAGKSMGRSSWPPEQGSYPATYGLHPGAVATGAADNANKLIELNRLKTMIAASNDLGDSQQTNQINSMLDKVLAIQQGYPYGKNQAGGQKVVQAEVERNVAGSEEGAPLSKADLLVKGAGNNVERSQSGIIYHLTPDKTETKVPLLSIPNKDIYARSQLDKEEPIKKSEWVDKLDGQKQRMDCEMESPGLNTVQLADYKSNNNPTNNKIKEKLPAGSIKGAFYDIDGNGSNDNGGDESYDDPAYEDTYTTDNRNGIDKKAKHQKVTALTIPASVATNQTIVSGGTVKLRLDKDIHLNDMLIPKGSFVFGNCQVRGERLRVAINHIRYKKQLLPVNLTVFDLDGLEGIHIPGSINRDAAKQGVDRGLSSVELMSMDASVAAQAASAGVEAVKGLFSKKVRLIRVTVKAGYPILLVDGKG